MKQTHMLSKISLLAFAVLAFLSGCSSEPTSTIEVSSDGTATISRVHRDIIDDGLIKHSEVLDCDVTFTQTINGKHIEVLDGNVTYNGEKIARPENSTLKVTQKHASVFIYVDDKLVREVRIDK